VLNSSTASISTEKTDYAPGSVVTLTGAGWESGETVKIILHEEPTLHDDDVLYSMADWSGTLINTDCAPESYDDGVTYTVTAKGESSGRTAQTSFTDKNDCNSDSDCNDGIPCTVDTCSGTSPNKVCTHTVGNAGAVCRSAANDCDAAETCTGTSATCPIDSFKPAGTACTDDGNPCTADVCNAIDVCTHPAGNAGAICRTAAGACDVAETCNGTSTSCPADGFALASTSCTGASQDGACDNDVADHCTDPSASATTPMDCIGRWQ
jgi:hypothetical protein